MHRWLMKSEPAEFSIDDLARRPDQTEPWDGVRNYQARNMLRDQMQPGDPVFFYHSSCALPGIVGIAEVASQGYPDPTAFDPQDPHFDAASDPAAPRWFLVEVRFVRRFERTIALAELKANPALAEMALLRRGNRLSIMPVSASEWQAILDML